MIAGLLHDERELLHPELRFVDAWGEIRALQLERSHRRQQKMLAQVREQAEQVEEAEMLETVGALRADLRKVEQRFLQPDLLRDDLVTVGQVDG